MKVEMLDLFSQYKKIESQIDKEVLKIIKGTNYINGPQVKEFENNLKNYLSISDVISCANGTDALQIALMSLGLKSGDEVIIPSFTYVATAEVIALLGLTPVFVEVDEKTFNIDCNSFESAITKKTKAVIPVHLFGQCADMEKIIEIAKKYSLFIIEDVAQAIGSTFHFSDGSKYKAGTMGNIGCTSFFPSKNLGCFGDGGAIFCDFEETANKIRKIANHGQKEKYHHEIIGVNSRLDTIQAGILNIKLKYLDQYTQARMNSAKIYDDLLLNIEKLEVPYRSYQSTHVFNQYTILVSEHLRDKLKNYLLEEGIQTMIYYPIPLHLQKAYFNPKFSYGSLPISEKLSKKALSLPMHTELTYEKQTFVFEKINKFFKYI
jgi:UDP-2-acetamido-2-deoxy-ribo-hexuluronate aminotransferase